MRGRVGRPRAHQCIDQIVARPHPPHWLICAQVTLQAAADAYGTRICLVTSYEDRGILRVEPAEPIEGEEPRTAWLAFWAEIHYSSIVPMGEAGEEVPA